MKNRLPALSCLTGLLGVLLLVAAEDSLAVTEILVPTVKGNVEWSGGFVVLDDNPIFGLVTQQLISNDPNVPSIDKKSILEFPLASIPFGATLTAATLELNVSLALGAVVPIFGYEGDGVAEPVDATVTPNVIGTSDSITQLGINSIDLDVEFITGLLDSPITHLGLLLIGDKNGIEASFGSLGVEPAVLSLSFDIPGDFDLDGDVDGYDFLKWQRGEVSSPPSADDLLDWENNYGTTTTLIAIASVPEPTTLCFVLLGALGLLANRQTCSCFSSRLQPPASSPNAESAASR